MASQAKGHSAYVSDSGNGGTAGWSGGNVGSSDNSKATSVSLSGTVPKTHWLRAHTSNLFIPEEATIEGIELRIEKHCGSSLVCVDEDVRLCKNGVPVGDNKPNATTWPAGGAADRVDVYGSPTDLWGTTWTYKDFNINGFGAIVSAIRTNGTGVCELDQIQATIYYAGGYRTFILETFDGTQEALGPNFTWTDLFGDFDLVSNAAVPQTLGGIDEAICDQDLFSENHFAEMRIIAYSGDDSVGTNTRPGVIVRADASGERTFYVGCINKAVSPDHYQIWKVVNGAYELLAEANVTAPTPPVVIKLRVDTVGNDADLEFLANDVVVLSYTDTSPLTGAGRTRVGIASSMGASATKPTYGEFAARDLHRRTRFFLGSSGTAPLPSLAFGATGNAWDKSDQADRLPAFLEPMGTPQVNAVRAGRGVTNSNVMIRQYQTEPIAAQSFWGKLIGLIPARETQGADNYCPQLLVKIVSNDGSVERGVLYAFNNGTFAQEFDGTLKTYGWPRDPFPLDGIVMNGVDSQDGDRIVFEVGFRQTSAATANQTTRYGDDATEYFTTLTSDTSLLNPLFEFTMDVEMQGAGGGPQTVNPTSIPSAEAWGAPRLNLQVVAAGIPSVEAWGSPSIRQLVTVPSISSEEAWGTPKLNQQLRPASIASAEAFGTPTLRTQVLPFSIPSAEAWGAPRLNLRVVAGGIGSAETWGTPVLRLLVRLVSIGSAEAFGAPKINQQLRPSSILSAETWGVPTLGGGAAVIHPLGIPSAEAWGVPRLNLRVTAGSIGSAEVWGTPRVRLQIGPSSIPSAEVWGAPRLNLRVTTSGIASAEMWGIPTIRRFVRPTSILSAETFGIPRLTLRIRPTGIPSAEAWGTPAVVSHVFVAPAGVPTAEVWGTPTVRYLIRAAAIASAEAWGLVTVTSTTISKPWVASGSEKTRDGVLASQVTQGAVTESQQTRDVVTGRTDG